MIALIGGWLAKSVLMQSPVGTFLKGISPSTWRIIAIGVALTLGFVWHQHTAHKALHQADATGYARAKAEDKAAMTKAHNDALIWKTQADAANAKIAQALKEKNDAELAHIRATADDLLRNGPGKARCGQVDYPGLPAAAGGHGPPAQSPAVAVAGMSDQGRAGLVALPFDATVAAFGQADADRAEVIAWHQWYEKMKAAWPKVDSR